MSKRRDILLRPILGLPSLGLALAACMVLPSSAGAIPGQPLRLAETWIHANPTLNPRPNEKFLIQRQITPAHRLTFEASVFPVTGISRDVSRTQIRTERFTVVDFINSVTFERLEESLRAIYGVEIFTDYRQANRLLAYPQPGTAVVTDPELVLQGELREGEKFAYWQELASDGTGHAPSGRFAIFLKEDAEAMRDQLIRDRLLVE